MIWTSAITANGQSADRVLGQTWFNSNSSGTSSSSLNRPYGVAINSLNYVFVSDSDNNRVLFWSDRISSNGQAANRVLGRRTSTTLVEERARPMMMALPGFRPMVIF
jgi:hypothetical protein